jgi:hypothetical protein
MAPPHWHYYDGLMKSIIIASVLFGGAVWAADEVADRAAIENTIRVFSLMPSRAVLYTSDFDHEELVRFGKTPDSGAIPVTVEGAPGTVVISKEPMGEAQWFPAGVHGSITVKKIRFVTADVAMVDAVDKGQVLIVLKRVGTDWKIASLRRLAE